MTENLGGKDAGDESAKDDALTASVKDEGFWKEMWHQIRLVWQLIRSPEVPLYLKILERQDLCRPAQLNIFRKR